MPLKHNLSNLNGAYVGTGLAHRIYCGTTLVYSAVDLISMNVSASGGTAGNATARANFTSGGLQQSKAGAAGYVTENTWKEGGAASLFEIRATLVGSTGSGSAGGSAFSSWISGATGAEWTAAAAVGNVFAAEILVEIRLASTGLVLASETQYLDSERF